MDNQIYLKRYRLSVGRNGLPVELHRAPTSVTYRAHEIATGREVALERVTADTSAAGFRELLESEAAVAQKISQLNIPTLYDFGFEEGELVFVTEHFDGHTAATWVGARGPLSTAATLRVALQVVAAMDAMAFHRIYHHALNPDNIIFLNAETEVRDWPPLKVLHWLGVAPLFVEAGDPSLDYAARFASPEQLYTARVDVRSEIYSLGCTMWFLLTGAPPVMTTAPGAGLPETRALDHVPKIVRHLILRMLRPEPDERPQDPVALNAFLQTCLARVERKEKGRSGVAVPFVRQGARFKPRKLTFAPRPMALAAGLVALALLAAFAAPRLINTKNTAPTESRANQAELATRNEMAPLQKRPATSVTSTRPKAEPRSSDADPIVEVSREFAGIPAGAVAGEPQPPEEGPSEQDNAPVVAKIVPLTTSPEVSAASAGEAPAQENEIPETRAPASAVVVEFTPPPPPEEDARPASATSESAPIVTAKNEPSQTTSLQDTVASAAPVPLTSEAPDPDPEPQDETTADTAAVTADESHQIAAEESQPPAGAEEARSVEDSPAPAVAAATPAPAVKKSRSASVAKALVKPKTKALSVARKSSRQTSSRKRVATPAVPRAQKLPELHFGSSRAELVGTTRSGQWILSVKSTGKKVIVPPPPGFVQK